MMFKTLILPLLLLSGEAPPHQSQLVEEKDHTHSWQNVMSEDDISAWVDENWRSSITHEGQTYSVFLIRTIVTDGDGQAGADITMAFDCSAQKIALVEMWIEVVAGQAAQKATPPSLKFEPADGASSDKMFAHACGTPLSE
ncbi:MAG: hypothetical protein ABJP34_05535 [Erythrobacter sp.]